MSEDRYLSYAAYTEEEDELEDWPGDPRTPSRHFHRRALTDDEDADDDDDHEHDLPIPDAAEPSQGFATHTAFDAYFQLASKPARTSANVFSALLPALSPEEFAAALSTARATEHTHALRPPLWADARTRRTAYRRFRMELDAGFNLLFYGCGSKRAVLNGLAGWLAEEGGAHVVVANGFQPAFAFRDLLGAIERVPGVRGGEGEAAAGGLDAQVQRIHAFFSQPRHPPSTSGPSSSRPDEPEAEESPHVYIIIHNIEGAAFRAPKHRSALALLALAPRIHLCASFDHVVGAPLRWSLSDIFARKPDPLSSSSTSPTRGPAQKRGFAWLWHDLTTLAPYDFELAYADPTMLTGASALRGARTPAASSAAAGGAGTAGAGGAAMTETAARHVLASVTQKAKKLFVLLGTKQLEVMDAQGVGAAGVDADAEGAFDYDRLFAAARDNFVAQNDTALRALLGEFRDHGLVVARAAPGGTGEALWIPLRRDALLKVVSDLTAEGA
ncbi:Origin of replication complex subunit 2 [Trametes pubescens]|uniref:Origin recognition complex subunit 2 n=1 Tax=Trametes pubescens TaxID=154538 RepID=A0A1M2VZH1_TRAPU|nr:Origin of replication complex subunit 2 [Trametes pubescens]